MNFKIEDTIQQHQTGNSQSVWAPLGASNHSNTERERDDYYATEPRAVELLLDNEKFDGTIWENCCGGGHIVKPMEARGYKVISTDLVDRGYGQTGVDFFKCTEPLGENIITNPPYKFCTEWVVHSLKLLKPGKKLALLLPIRFLETSERYRTVFKDTPPRTIYVSVNRLLCGKNGEFYQRNDDGELIYGKNGTPKKIASAVFYAWFVWEKDNYGDIKIKFINT